MICGIKKVEPTHGTPPATRLASNAAQPLNIIYHRRQKLSNGFFSGGSSLCIINPYYSDCEEYRYRVITAYKAILL